jgi:hypothetical protein
LTSTSNSSNARAAPQRFCGIVFPTKVIPVLKDLIINFALWMSVRRAKQSENKLNASTWWSDLSEAIEEGISLREVQARHPANGKPVA